MARQKSRYAGIWGRLACSAGWRRLARRVGVVVLVAAAMGCSVDDDKRADARCGATFEGRSLREILDGYANSEPSVDSDGNVSRAGDEVLRRVPDAIMLDFLRCFVASEDAASGSRVSALYLMRARGGAAEREVIVELLRDSDAMVRLAAADNLALLGEQLGAEGESVVTQELESDDERVRRFAAIVYENSNLVDIAALPRLRAFLDDPDIRVFALMSLQRLGPSGLPAQRDLLRLLDTGVEPVLVLRVLGGLGIGAREQAGERIRLWLMRTPDPNVLREAVGALRCVQFPLAEIRKTLEARQAESDVSPSMRETIVEMLNELPKT